MKKGLQMLTIKVDHILLIARSLFCSMSRDLEAITSASTYYISGAHPYNLSPCAGGIQCYKHSLLSHLDCQKVWRKESSVLIYICSCSVAKLHLTLHVPVDCSTPGFPVLHHLTELAQTHVYSVGDAIQPSHHLLPPYPPAFNLSQHQGLFQGVGSLHQLAKGFELQHQYFQWILKVNFL